jgi:uncharacterized membrane protein YqhA
MEKNPRKISVIEKVFEACLWSSRYIVLLAVVFGVIGSISLFIMGSIEVFHTAQRVFSPAYRNEDSALILIGIVGAIDLYLIGIVLLIFSFGVYELFISKIDIARFDEGQSILEIESLDELKNKILKVVIMVLIVSFFKSILSLKYETPLEMLYYSISIIGISAAVYLMRKKDAEKE